MGPMETVTTPLTLPGARVERLVLGELQNNTWIIGSDGDAIVIDPSQDAFIILDALSGRTLTAILITHGHHDHIGAARTLSAATGAPVWLHPADRFLWDEQHPTPPDADLTHGTEFPLGTLVVRALHTPGHTPGSTSFHVPALATVFTGDTLFEGGPGATRWGYSSFPQIIDSISANLLGLPPDTLVLTGHGPATTIADEAADLDAWVARGW